jgi:choline dehydrogenase-like flavoprotein
MADIVPPNGETHRKLIEEHKGLEERRCHIVVGGGSSGILLCNQLLEHDDVILIERGSQNPHSTHVTSRTPYLWPVAAFAKGEGTRSQSLPMCSLSNRTMMYPQGAGVGGTSNLNAMILSAGHPGVFNNHWHQNWSSGVMSRFVGIARRTHSTYLVQMFLSV